MNTINHSYLYFFCFAFIFLFFVLSYGFSKQIFSLKEGFTWSTKSIDDFIFFQNTVNPTTQFNLKMVQEQASENELQELLKTGYWPWTKDTQYLYLDAVYHNKIIKINPQSSMNYVRKIYNENAIKQLLSWNTKEGQFLLDGVSLPDDNGTIQCKIRDDDNTPVMTKTSYTGYNLWNGYKNMKTDVLRNDQLPKEISGFHFVKDSCNPCVALNNDYTCPFQINVKDNNHMSEIWKRLWGFWS